jgi:tellurite resistance protein TehA-like permease
MYVCNALNPDGSCAAFVAVLDGVASMEQIGITTDTLGFAFGWGFGAVMLFFAIGLGLRSARQILELALGGPST